MQATKGLILLLRMGNKGLFDILLKLVLLGDPALYYFKLQTSLESLLKWGLEAIYVEALCFAEAFGPSKAAVTIRLGYLQARRQKGFLEMGYFGASQGLEHHDKKIISH